MTVVEEEGFGQALEGVRVLDVATVYAGPLTAALLADFGAEVIKIEHPRGDPLRTHGKQEKGHGLWWKSVGRNKFAATLDLSKPRGQELFRDLVAQSDVVIESFRPGVMERWGLGWDELSSIRPSLIMLRVSGFGQTGPYRERPGFGTLAEAMSGFAAMTGAPDSPPVLPPFGLADGIAGWAGTAGVLLALFHRQRDEARRGQMIDLSLVEPITSVLGAQATIYQLLGETPRRTGNRSANNAPRNLYRSSDGKWVAVSSSTTSVAQRVMTLVGRPDLVEQPWFTTGSQRAEHSDVLDAAVADWIGERSRNDVITAFTDAGAAAAPVYDISDLVNDPQIQARGTFVTVDDDDLGELTLQVPPVRLSATPGRISFPGRRVGQDNSLVYEDMLGLTPHQVDELASQGVI